MPGRSRASLFRDLRGLEYLSSFNKAGRYFTLKSIADFNENGIWRHEGAFFSRQGTLKKTVKHLVDDSIAGYTHYELQKALDVRVHNTLHGLVSAGALSREQVAGNYVYTSTDPTNGPRQLGQRQKQQDAAQSEPPQDPYLTIEVLRAVIRHPDQTAKDIGRALNKESVKIQAKQVESIFDFYGLGKKNSQ